MMALMPDEMKCEILFLYFNRYSGYLFRYFAFHRNNYNWQIFVVSISYHERRHATNQPLYPPSIKLEYSSLPDNIQLCKMCKYANILSKYISAIV